MRSQKFKLSNVGVGWGGLRCSCCAPKAGTKEFRRLMRSARRIAKRMSRLQEQIDHELDTQYYPSYILA